jgi:hypothetical protein
VALTWTDGTLVNYLNPNSWTLTGAAIGTAEVGYRVERALGAGAFALVTNGNALANQITFTDTPPNLTSTWRYRVTAWNAAGNSFSNIVTVAPAVVLRATTTTVTSNRTPSATFGQTVNLTAAVRPTVGAGTATGSVRFTVDGVVPAGGVVTLNVSGNAVYSTSSLGAGSHTVVAAYLADAVFAASTSATYTQVVNKAATVTTMVSSSLNPSRVVSGPVTFTARTTPVGNVGTIQFTINGVNVGAPQPLNAIGQATFSNTFAAVGTYAVRAVYITTANYLASTSAPLSQVVTL